MGRAKALASTAIRGVHAAREHQITIFERLEDLTRRARRHDPVAPAIAIFCIVLALSMIGLIVQASHAATTLPAEEFSAELKKQVLFRCAGLAVMLGAARLGPSGLRRRRGAGPPGRGWNRASTAGWAGTVCRRRVRYRQKCWRP